MSIISGQTNEEWLRILEQAATDVSTIALGFDGCALGSAGVEVPHGLRGSYIPIQTPEAPMQLGLLSDDAGCQRLAKALLGMEVDSEPLPEVDLGDSVSEILNVLAGGIKRRMRNHDGVLLGLPLFVAGTALAHQRSTLLTVEIQLGPVGALLLVAGGSGLHPEAAE